KWKDDDHFVNSFFHHLYPVLFPCPHLWRNIIDDAKAFLFCPFCNTKIEPGIINEDQHIWLKLFNIFFAKFKIAKNGKNIFYHLPKPHKSKIAIMLYQLTACLLHFIATPATNDRGSIQLLQFFNEIAAV